MTMQVGVRALNGCFVLAGDTKCRVTEATHTSAPVPSGILSHGKVAICKPHQLAIAVAGNGALGESPERELAEHLAALDVLPDEELGPLLAKWAKEYFEQHSGGRRWEVLMHSLLIINPKAQYTPLWKLRVGQQCSFDMSGSYMVNGNETNTAIFWPEFFKCDRETYNVAATSRIAGLTILSGGELNPYGVGGLEIWTFDGRWSRYLPEEIETITARLQTLKNLIYESIL